MSTLSSVIFLAISLKLSNILIFWEVQKVGMKFGKVDSTTAVQDAQILQYNVKVEVVKHFFCQAVNGIV